MLIELLLNLSDFIITPLLNILGTIFEITNIDIILKPISTGINKIFEMSAGLIWLVCDVGFLFDVLKIVLAIETGFALYKTTMWAIKKIPMMSIKE